MHAFLARRNGRHHPHPTTVARELHVVMYRVALGAPDAQNFKMVPEQQLRLSMAPPSSSVSFATPDAAPGAERPPSVATPGDRDARVYDSPGGGRSPGAALRA